MTKLNFAVILIMMLGAALIITARQSSARTDVGASEIVATYRQFADAQNAHDLVRVRSFLLDRPDFLWVTDGMSVWGVDNTIARMAQFQKAKIWRVEPDISAAKPVTLNDGAGFLHLPLSLVIGAEPTPEVHQFLVSVLWLKTPEGWRIAGLLTTTKHP
jgi:ketosteroid isomerase-like protein